MLGANIKVHFAAVETADMAIVLKLAKVKYCLFTVYPFIAKKAGIKASTFSVETCENFFVPKAIASFTKHTIMDSGLFTLMFGAQAGQKDALFLEKWLELLCDFVKSHDITATCVEVDCQKILGVEHAWRFRKQMRDMLPHNKIINVFHYEDGKKGLDRLIEFSDYIAISVPELRICKRGTFKQDVYMLTNYIKNKKPDIDIHLLGCTDLDILKQNKFCTSCDSTSWKSINRYGFFKGRHVSLFKSEKLQHIRQEIIQKFQKLGVSYTDKLLLIYMRFYVAALLLKDEYTLAVGSQE